MHSTHPEFKASHRAKPHADGVGKHTPPVKAGGRGRHCWEFILAKNRIYHILNMRRLSHRGIQQVVLGQRVSWDVNPDGVALESLCDTAPVRTSGPHPPPRPLDPTARCLMLPVGASLQAAPGGPHLLVLPPLPHLLQVGYGQCLRPGEF